MSDYEGLGGVGVRAQAAELDGDAATDLIRRAEAMEGRFQGDLAQMSPEARQLALETVRELAP